MQPTLGGWSLVEGNLRPFELTTQIHASTISALPRADRDNRGQLLRCLRMVRPSARKSFGLWPIFNRVETGHVQICSGMSFRGTVLKSIDDASGTRGLQKMTAAF